MTREIRLRPVLPNAGIEAAYRRQLAALIKAMRADVLGEVGIALAGEAPTMAADDIGFGSPAALIGVMRRLGVKWRGRFDDLADALARGFVDATGRRSDAAFMAALRKAGFAVRFSMTPKVATMTEAAVAENVALIRSIPAQCLTQVEGEVMRAVQAGGKLGPLTRALQDQFAVTERRAAFIARDQNAKATSAIVRARQIETGITHAIWRHSGGGKHPRPEHVRANGKSYPVEKGMYLEGEWQFPGIPINCRCISVPIMPWGSSG